LECDRLAKFYALDAKGVIRFKAMDDGESLDAAVDQVLADLQNVVKPQPLIAKQCRQSQT